MKFPSLLITVSLITALYPATTALGQSANPKKTIQGVKPIERAVPPADGGRGLIRVSPTEIRHYSGDKKRKFYLVSKDNGKTWEEQDAPESYPPNFGGLAFEAPAITWIPSIKHFIRVQPIGGFVFMAPNLDGKWKAVRKDGKWEENWATMSDADRKAQLLTLGSIMRSPIAVNQGKRILVPAHDMRSGSYCHISDDGGLTWKRSKDTIKVPQLEVKPPHKGPRWYNAGVEPSIVELKDGRLMCLMRTSQDQHWQSFSKDYGNTWSKPEPSPFFGTLTMITVGRLNDGRLIALWTSTAPLPEGKHGGSDQWENGFTNRDSHHIALSSDEGKTWQGFREICLNSSRNASDYVAGGDLGNHQGEFVDLGKGKILVSLGQNARHRRIYEIDSKWVYEKSRATDLKKDGLDDWTYHAFIPKVAGHCAYNRKPGATLEEDGMHIKFMDDASLINEKEELDYRAGGATWNFPSGETGRVTLKFKLLPDSKGLHISLADRLFNACDTSAPDLSIYSLIIKPDKNIQTDKEYTLTMTWKGVKKDTSTCTVLIDNKPYKVIKAQNTSPHGINYLHLLSAAQEPDNGAVIISAKAIVK